MGKLDSCLALRPGSGCQNIGPLNDIWTPNFKKRLYVYNTNVDIFTARFASDPFSIPYFDTTSHLSEWVDNLTLCTLYSANNKLSIEGIPYELNL